MRSTPFAFLVCVLTSGCISTADELKQTAEKNSFDVPRDYQAVFRDVRAYSKRCLEGGTAVARLAIDGQLYTDIRSGEIDISMRGIAVTRYLYSIEITSTGPSASRVVIGGMSKNLHDLAVFTRIIKGEPVSCEE